MLVKNKHISISIIALWLCLTMVFIGFKGVYEGWNNEQTDFNNYYISSVLLLEGEKIHSFYDNALFAEKSIQNGIVDGAKFSPFTPITSIIYLPLTFWELLTAKRIWLVLNLFLLVIFPFRIKKYFNFSILQSILVLSLFFVPISSNLNFGQVYLVITFFMVEFVGRWMTKKSYTYAAVGIAFFTLIKYLPMFYLMYFLSKRKKIKYIIIVFLVSILCFIGFIYLLDPKAYLTYFDVFNNHLNGDLSGQGKFAVGFQSIDALLNNLFVLDLNENPNPLLNLSVLKPIIKFVMFALITGICLRIFVTDNYRFTPINSSIFIFAAFTMFPASASYHFLFLLVPILYILQDFFISNNRKLSIVFISLLLTTFIIQQHHIPQIDAYPTFNLLIHFPRLWNLFLLFAFLSIIKFKIKLK